MKNVITQPVEPGKLKLTSMVILIVALFSIFIFTSSYAYKMVSSNVDETNIQYALVEGNVKNPGYYKIDEMTTNYDLLAKAELTDSSQIKGIDLSAPPDPKSSLEVGVSEEKVEEKKNPSYSEPRLEFVVGKTSVKRSLKTEDGKLNQALYEKDLLFTRKDGSAVVTFSNMAKMSLDIKSKVRLKKIPDASKGGAAVLDVLSGRVLLSVPTLNGPSKLLLRTAKAKIKLSKGDVEFSIRASKSKTLIYVFKGTVKIQRNSDKEVITLKSGQRALIGGGDETLAASENTKATKKEKAIFAKIDEQFKEHKNSQKEVSVLIASKGFNFVLSMVPEKKRVILMSLPPNVYVGDYINGVFRLDQSMVLAGPELTREVVQRLIGRPLPYVLTLNIQNVTEYVYTIDGLMVEVDVGAASAMGITPGLQRLTQRHILMFLNPVLPGGEAMAQKRQEKVLLAFLRKLQEGGVSSFTHYLVPLLKSVETNLPVKMGLQHFTTFSNYDNWQVINTPLPSEPYMVGPMVLAKPRYDDIQSMYN